MSTACNATLIPWSWEQSRMWELFYKAKGNVNLEKHMTERENVDYVMSTSLRLYCFYWRDDPDRDFVSFRHATRRSRD